MTSINKIISLKSGAEYSKVENIIPMTNRYLPYGNLPIYRGWKECPRLYAQKLSGTSILVLFTPRSTLSKKSGTSAYKRLFKEPNMLHSISYAYASKSSSMGIL